MPRIHAIKTTKVYLPSSNKADPPTLEVLVMAQKIARDRGQVFDIEAFMPPEMREEWMALQRGKGSPKVKAEEMEMELVAKDGDGSRVEEEVDVGPGAEAKGELGEPPAANTEESGKLAVPGEGQDNIGSSSELSSLPTDSVAQPSTTLNSDEAVPTPAPVDEANPPQPVKEPFKLHANHPVLLNLHWKQRQKRLAQLAARDAAIARGEVPEYFPELEALIRGEEEKEKEKAREEEVGQKRKRGLTAADIEGIRASASHW
jgi:hypothetical protein